MQDSDFIREIFAEYKAMSRALITIRGLVIQICGKFEIPTGGVEQEADEEVKEANGENG